MIHMFRLLKKGSNPKQHHCTSNTQIGDNQWSYSSTNHYKLRNRRHQSPHNICSEHRSMSLPTNLFHFYNITLNTLNLLVLPSGLFQIQQTET